MEYPGDGYCYECGSWRELNTEAMCDGCYDAWRAAYQRTVRAILAACDIS